MKIGIIGCGNISSAYFDGAKHCANIEIKGCADIHMPAATAQAEKYGLTAMSVEALLADPEIELVVNLTIPRAHAQTGIQILEAGKHVYAEKPLALDLAEAKQLLAAAEKAGKRVGSAPDTFLFDGAQTARKLIDDGWIGKPVSGTAIMTCHGHESWHPNPAFYYDLGGGPLLDMGPYYIAGLVNLIGPVKSVMARGNRAYDQRLATSEKAKGQLLPVHVDTYHAGVLEFVSGAIVTVIMSFDTFMQEGSSQITLQGTHGGLMVGDPNNYAQNPLLFRPEDTTPRDIPFTHAKNKRMIGVVDMVDAIENNRPHRASSELAFHTLEVMRAFEASTQNDRAIFIETRPDRPEALPQGLPVWTV